MAKPIPQILAAACVAAGFLLSGCGDTPSAGEAQREAQRAAHRAASAGQPRATDDLVSLVSNTSDDRKVQADITANSKKYLTQNAAEKDLFDAVAEIKKATGGDITDAAKSSYSYQLG